MKDEFGVNSEIRFRVGKPPNTVITNFGMLCEDERGVLRCLPHVPSQSYKHQLAIGCCTCNSVVPSGSTQCAQGHRFEYPRQLCGMLDLELDQTAANANCLLNQTNEQIVKRIHDDAYKRRM